MSRPAPSLLLSEAVEVGGRVEALKVSPAMFRLLLRTGPSPHQDSLSPFHHLVPSPPCSQGGDLTARPPSY